MNRCRIVGVVIGIGVGVVLLILGADKATVYYIIYLHNPVVISCLVNTVTLVIRTHRLIYCLLRALSSIPVFGSLSYWYLSYINSVKCRARAGEQQG